MHAVHFVHPLTCFFFVSLLHASAHHFITNMVESTKAWHAANWQLLRIPGFAEATEKERKERTEKGDVAVKFTLVLSRVADKL